MKMMIKFALALMSPYLLIVYWRNSMKELGDLHVEHEFSTAD